MAAVTSLGLHKPTGLAYLIQEGLLPAEPDSNLYTWEVIANGDDYVIGVDELIHTKTCVVWCSGGVVRKSFRFEIEEEPVTKALLTTFASDQHDLHSRTNTARYKKSNASTGLTNDHTNHPDNSKNTPARRSRALVVFLKTQAHIYFLSGTSHTIHLPFEVENVVTAPNGLILQRKPNVDCLEAVSFKIPLVPSNTFTSSQLPPWSAASSIQSTFSIASLGSPKQLSLPKTQSKGNNWQTPQTKDDSNWPRLFSLTDPLAELGLVVTNSKSHGNRRVSLKSFALDPAEELLHITKRDEFISIQSSEADPIILATTINREKSCYTVWRVQYVEQEDMLRHLPLPKSNGGTRRRSSFAPGASNGTTTPAVTGQYAFRESIGAPGLKSSKRVDDKLADEMLDLATSLDPEFEEKGIPRRKSRRVSSMVARSDVSASHERSAYHELGTNHHQTKRRVDSLGSQQVRTSFGQAGVNGYIANSQFGNSLNSFLEAPVDDLLDELRAGGDFEGFHSMGLDDEDFEGFRKEVVFVKIESVPLQPSNIRFSTQHTSVSDKFSVFTLTAPQSASEDPRKGQIIVAIRDKTDQELIVITLETKTRFDQGEPRQPTRASRLPRSSTNITCTVGNVKRARGVLDACKLTDGDITRMLILTETSDGRGELTLQASWSQLVRLSLPSKMAISNMQSIGHDATPQKRREGSFRRVFSDGIHALRSLRFPGPGGVVDVIDDEGNIHQIKILLEPRDPLVKKVINVCRAVLPGSRGGDSILVGWWNVRQWLADTAHPQADDEWSALVVIVFALILGAQDQPTAKSTPSKKRKVRSHLRSSSFVPEDDENWQSMLSFEAANSCSQPAWMDTPAWEWLGDQITKEATSPATSSRQLRQKSGILDSEEADSSLQTLVHLALDFLASEAGQAAVGNTEQKGYLPTTRHRGLDFRVNTITDVLTGLHLLREEQKLDIATTDRLSTGNVDLAPVLAQLYRWVGWKKWVDVYDSEDAAISNIKFDPTKLVDLPEPPNVPNVYQWIESCFVAKRLGSYVTIADITLSRSTIDHSNASHLEQWSALTPRTSLFMDFFNNILPQSSPIEIIEALHKAGLTTKILETLPEGVLIPLRESVISCQTEPSVSWDRDLLNLVDRADVNLLLYPETHRSRVYSSILAPTHEASYDMHSIILDNEDIEHFGAGVANVDRQVITNLIFKDDRRSYEAEEILNTTRPKRAHLEPQSEWNESELLEAQKEHVQMLATRTLATPTGRGLLHFGARVPLLTEKFPISGFNLNCIIMPSQTTVAVEKMNFTEEKVCWAFFHSGVSAGLSISRDAKGIDTSWILYNKPQELSNRHAGFLLALGLNGHLKSIAKWVAFKYLTPKHTMTSVGLLLGLAASYLGTMDSLITRLLSVHVVRMLPHGAAELNLSSLTQTSGIMGIGLLYCNTQHRRMSEIMLSEVEHIEPELEGEPLRNEGYRLASGFALGFINLGKGTDLRGLHDLRLTERLLKVAVGTKQVDLVHILDKATAGAIVAIALIFMKSENLSLARKIDVPSSMPQYDYVRPDMFLLRTMARHLIMWNEIEASESWIKRMLPEAYQHKSKLSGIYDLSSEDLPFYNIVTGLLFSIALRYAGTGSLEVRDLLLHYVDQLFRLSRITSVDYDQKLTRTTVRNCLDLTALFVSAVMAGTGDIATFRRLRALHGRDDPDTPYGSHLAAHIAVGALFLGGGTHTFGTSNLAVASLIVSFYPLLPATILDNKSHLQAFRHFWVLATEPRCLIMKDLDTNTPVSVPLSITLKTGMQSVVHAPCLLPDLNLIDTIQTTSQEYWNIVLEFGTDDRVHKMFSRSQTVWVRRKQSNDSSTAVFQATLQAFDIKASATSSPKSAQPLEWLFDLPALSNFTKAERSLVLGSGDGAASTMLAMEGTAVDIRLILERATLMSGKKDRLEGLKLLFAWKEACEKRGEDMKWVRGSVIDGLRARVWLLGNEIQGNGGANS